jgi:hypothetical protein
MRTVKDDTFLLPPVVHNPHGDVRRAGFELEFAGVSLNLAADAVRKVFGGEHVIHSTFVHSVRGTRVGEFSVEMDTTVLKDKTYEKPLRALGLDPRRMDAKWLEEALLGAFSRLVPTEIATPPLPVNELDPLDDLRALLRDRGAMGSRASVLYAFGLHINPEITSDAPAHLLNVLRAFVLLYPWLKREAEVDPSRRISPYINSFPAAYVRLILRPDYPVTRQRLIDDYLEHNPTRNRPLDMTPLLAHLEPQRVSHRVQEKHLLKPRPAFHYRLPNCMVDEPGWTIAREWNTWVAVERLAADPARVEQMSLDYLDADRRSLRPFYDKWPDVLEHHISQDMSGAPS